MFGKGRKRKAFRPTKTKKRRSIWPAPSLLGMQLSTLRDNQFFDTSVAASIAATTAAYVNIFLPTLGTGRSNRYGDKTVMLSISWSIFVNPINVTGPFRMILFYDKQTNGAAPPSPDPLTADGAHTFKNPDLRHRYIILRDWIVSNDTQDSGLANPARDYIQKGRLTCRLPTMFTASAGAVADIATGSLYLYYYNAGANTTGTAGTVRVLFTS